MLLAKYKMQLLNPPCNPSVETLNAIVELEDDLTELLPYVNAELGPGMYNPDVPFLRLLKHGRTITIQPKKIAIARLRDDGEAKEVLAWLKEQINSVNDRRNEIEPSYETIGQVKALDVFKLLPKTNCGRCGQRTCLAFAAAVAAAEANVEDCPPLSSHGFEQQRQALFQLLGMEE